MTSTASSATSSDHHTHASHPAHEPHGEGTTAQKFRLASIYIPSSAERVAMQSRYEAKVTESQRPDGSLDLSALPPNPPAAIPIFEGEDGKLYVLGNKQGKSIAMPFKRTRDFDVKHAARGGYIDAKKLQGPGTQPSASPGMQRSLSNAATNVSGQQGTQNTEQGKGSSGGSGSTLGTQAVQAGIQALEGLTGQALATMLAGGGFGSGPGKFNFDGLGQMGLGQLMGYASSQLMAMWGIDDSSSMGEQVAKKITQDIVGKLQGELMSEISSGHSLFDKGALEEFFTGIKSTKPQLPIARETDPTSHGGVLKSTAAKTFINTLKPIRTLDTHVCPKCEGSTSHVGGPVREGNPTILIEGQLASRLDHAAICTGVGMETKATPPVANVFIGAATVPVLLPPEPKLQGKEVAEAASSAAPGQGGSKDSKSSPADRKNDESNVTKNSEPTAEELEQQEKTLLDKIKTEDPDLYDAITKQSNGQNPVDESRLGTPVGETTDPATGHKFTAFMKEVKVSGGDLITGHGGGAVMYLRDNATGEVFIYDSKHILGGGAGISLLPFGATYSTGNFPIVLADGTKLPPFAVGHSGGGGFLTGYSEGYMLFGNKPFDYNMYVNTGSSNSIGIQYGAGSDITFYHFQYLGSCFPDSWTDWLFAMGLGMGDPCEPTK